MDKLYLLDASGYLYRSYHAIQGMTNARGESTNALFGFIRSVLKFAKDFSPTHLAAVFDGPKSTEKRVAMYAAYKAKRRAMPGDLRYQIEWAHTFCRLMGIPDLSEPGVEADDTMGSVAHWAEKHGCQVYLCTSDKDMAQLVNERVHILNTFKDNLIIGSKEVEEIYGVPPAQMVDWLTITGDVSDNVPGLPGFGPKTATALLKEFGSLDALLKHPEKLKGKKRETVEQYGAQAPLSRQLVTIDTQVDFPKREDFFKWQKPDLEGLKAFYLDMNFNSLVRELAEPIATVEAEPETVQYHLVDDEESLQALVSHLKKHKEICLDTETTGIRPMLAELVGIGLGTQAKEAWYVPMNGKLGAEKVLGALKPLFENPHFSFYGHNIKYDAHILWNVGIHMANICFDSMLASYVLNSHQRRHSIDDLSLQYYGKKKTAIETLIGKGKNEISMRDVPIERVCAYCCEDVDYACRLKTSLSQALDERGLRPVLMNLELPLLPVLLRMERHGIYVDAELLRAMGKQITSQIAKIEEEVYALAGERFNLNSPRQLSDILFIKMGIRPPRKTATGHSTNADVLESLSENHPLAGKVLEYRSLEKLRSTYVESLPYEINSQTGRIHPNFNQSVAATGRLSCQDPNLQNIPVRTEAGRRIRTAFMPQHRGWSFLSADYSQVELRLLAHLSEDPTLLHAFHHKEDIHAHTAAIIFGVPIQEVTPSQRHQAKAVNFGVIYGQQAFGLGRELGIDFKSASTFIDLYFKRYPKVKGFVEGVIAQARKSGRAVTMTGRERLIPEILSQNGALRTAAERLAINTPLQGSAADLIKLAMIKLDQELRRLGKRSFLVLQIHDELLLEVPDEEIEEVMPLVRDVMQGAMTLKVPLTVDVKVGKNWAEC